MKFVFVKKTNARIPRRKIEIFLKVCFQELKKRNVVNSENLLGCELSFVFLGSKEMKSINHRFRNKAKVTDVLSFSDSVTPLVGEIVFCVPRVQEQANENAWTELREYQYLALHGLLHLLGFDHEKGPRQAKRMLSLQDQVFSTVTGVELSLIHI